jgi:YD repeat-containing protein
MTSLSGTLDGTTQVNLTYGYDNAGRLTAITDLQGNRKVTFTYNTLGQTVTLTRYADAAGTQLVAATASGDDQANRLTSLVHALGESGATTLAYALQYDANNQITQFTTPMAAVTTRWTTPAS